MAIIDRTSDDSREQRYLNLAYAASSNANCPAAQVGALLVTKSGARISGWNGAQEGPSCNDEGCIVIASTARNREYSRHLHAEMDVLLTCARYAIATDGAELFVTKLPCYDCMKFIIHAGVKTVWFPSATADPACVSPVFDLADDCHVRLRGL